MRRLVYASLFVLGMGVLSCGQEKKVEAEKPEATKEMEQVDQATEETHDHSGDMAAAVYQCPMKCEGEEKTYDEPGSCPICKMDLKEIEQAAADEEESSEG